MNTADPPLPPVVGENVLEHAGECDEHVTGEGRPPKAAQHMCELRGEGVGAVWEEQRRQESSFSLQLQPDHRIKST